MGCLLQARKHARQGRLNHITASQPKGLGVNPILQMAKLRTSVLSTQPIVTLLVPNGAMMKPRTLIQGSYFQEEKWEERRSKTSFQAVSQKQNIRMLLDIKIFLRRVKNRIDEKYYVGAAFDYCLESLYKKMILQRYKKKHLRISLMGDGRLKNHMGLP